MTCDGLHPTRTLGETLGGVVRAMRPRQWIKNVLVVAAPLATLGGAVRYDYAKVCGAAGAAFVVFSLAASAIYLVNDARDVSADRVHPTKRFRPIAAGVVAPTVAYLVAIALSVASLSLSMAVSPALTLVVGTYLAIQLAYCLGLKHQVVLDICIVSSAYLRRICCVLSRVVRRRESRCRNGSCWSWHSHPCSWLLESVMRNCNSLNAPAPRFAAR